MNSGKVLLGVLAGIAIGATLGILFAPKKGSVTRKKILKKGDDYAESLKKRYNKAVGSISDKYEEAKEDVSDFTDQTQAKIKKVKKKVRAATS